MDLPCSRTRTVQMPRDTTQRADRRSNRIWRPGKTQLPKIRTNGTRLPVYNHPPPHPPPFWDGEPIAVARRRPAIHQSARRGKGKGGGDSLYKALTPVRGPPCGVELSKPLEKTASLGNLIVAKTWTKLDLGNRKYPNQRNGGYIIDWGYAAGGTGGDPGWRRSTSKPPGRRH